MIVPKQVMFYENSIELAEGDSNNQQNQERSNDIDVDRDRFGQHGLLHEHPEREFFEFRKAERN